MIGAAVGKLILILVLALGGFVAPLKDLPLERLPYADEMEEAARIQQRAGELIKAEKLRRGIELAEEDVWEIGILISPPSPPRPAARRKNAPASSRISRRCA